MRKKMTNIHRIKCFLRFFHLTEDGKKLFEIRKMDREYKVGDIIELNETHKGTYTGRMAMFRIECIITDSDFPEGINKGYAVLGISPITETYGGDNVESN